MGGLGAKEACIKRKRTLPLIWGCLWQKLDVNKGAERLSLESLEMKQQKRKIRGFYKHSLEQFPTWSLQQKSLPLLLHQSRIQRPFYWLRTMGRP